MNRTSIGAAALASLLLICVAAPVRAWDRGHAEILAVLPDGSTGPEGLIVGPDGNVYVATFGFISQGPVSGLGQLFVFKPSGRLVRQVGIAGSSSHLLGLAFHPMTRALLVIDRDDSLWICANQEDEIVVVDPSGNVIAKRGDFEGVDQDGVPHGLLFPASPAFSLGRELINTLCSGLPESVLEA